MRVIFNVIFCILIVFVSGCNENKTAIDISSKKKISDVDTTIKYLNDYISGYGYQ